METIRGFADDYKMSEEDTIALAAVIDRKEFRLIENLILWQVAVLTDRAMQSEDEKETLMLKGGVSALKNMTIMFKDIWRKGQLKEQQAILEMTRKDAEKEKKSPRVFE